MDEGPTEPREVPYLRLFPWLRLFRGVRMSLDARKLILAALGLVAWRAGAWGLEEAFGRAEFAPARLGTIVGPEPEPAVSLADLAGRVAGPARDLAAPFAALFSPRGDGRRWLHAALAAAWGVLVWGIVGGAIARVAAVEAATGERIGLGTAARFALRRWFDLVATPLSPLIGVGFFAGLCALLGLLYRIPGPAGATVAGALAFLPLLAGLVMALILVGLALGWPLMVATVAAEGEDLFEALSRSYGYTFQRPGLYAFYAAVAWAIGLVGLVVVGVFAALVVQLAAWGLALGGPDDRVLALFGSDPAQVGTAPAAAHGFWLDVVGALARGWVFAYFWTATTLVYLLLRRDVDGADWHEVYLPEHDADTFAPVPVAGPQKAPGEVPAVSAEGG
jgi:hypothetical protein